MIDRVCQGKEIRFKSGNQPNWGQTKIEYLRPGRALKKKLFLGLKTTY